jgi:hypothetical protein
MNKKELLQIAKLYGIKGRHRMSKDKLINAILKKREPIDRMKNFEERLKQKKLPQNYNENHIELLPKEPGTVYVHWEVKYTKNSSVLKLLERKKAVLAVPVMSKTGDGYMHVEEGKSLKAVIGIEGKDGFSKIVESEEIFVPVSKPSNNKTVRMAKVNLKDKKTKKVARKVKVTEELEEKKKNTEKVAKTVKYIHIPKERQND